jgi:hypothetical protein
MPILRSSSPWKKKLGEGKRENHLENEGYLDENKGVSPATKGEIL